MSTYATVPEPVMLSFGPDGTLFVGRDPVASGSITPTFVSSVGVGGTPVLSLGDAPIGDPDTPLLDTAGTISGVPGALLVTGLLAGGAVGRISGIHPDGTVFTIFDGGSWANIVELKFDLDGRLVFTGVQSRSIWTSTGGTPTILATLPGSGYPTFFAIDSANRIVVAATDNVIRVFNADGSLANGSLATVNGMSGLEFGLGGAFGTHLYTVDTGAGTLVSVTAAGVKTVVGTGFPTGFAIKDLAFDEAGDLFASVNTTDQVLRISATWTDMSCALAGVAGLPQLVGSGTLVAGSNNSADLTGVAPSSLAALFLALSGSSLPFKGGTLKPFPFFVPVLVGTSPAGTLIVPFVMPAGAPTGTELWAQWAIQDAAAVKGVALSNAIRGVTP